MFGIFNPTKLIFTVVIVFAIWQGFKWFGRWQDQQAQAKKSVNKSGSSGGSKAPTDAGDASAVEMVQCKTCGDYVASSGQRSCGRDDCPYPG